MDALEQQHNPFAAQGQGGQQGIHQHPTQSMQGYQPDDPSTTTTTTTGAGAEGGPHEPMLPLASSSSGAGASGADGPEEEEALEPPAPPVDPEEQLRLEIELAHEAMKQFTLTQITEEDIAAAELEEALMLHQMSQEGEVYIASRSSFIPHPSAPSAANTCLLSEPSVRNPASATPEDEVQVETEMQKFQARIKRTVEKDIKKMLLSSKAYVKHHAAPPTISHKQICNLAAPKAGLLHSDTAMALEAGSDYSEYARRKTLQLQQARQQAEAEQARAALQADVLQQQLHNYRGWKGQRAQLKSEILAKEAEQQQAYGKQMARYVAHKATADLEQFKAKQAVQKARAVALHQEISAQVVGKPQHQGRDAASQSPCLVDQLKPDPNLRSVTQTQTHGCSEGV